MLPGGAVAPPTKLLGEQVIHPAPPIFLQAYFFQIFWTTSHTSQRYCDRGLHSLRRMGVHLSTSPFCFASWVLTELIYRYWVLPCVAYIAITIHLAFLCILSLKYFAYKSKYLFSFNLSLKFSKMPLLGALPQTSLYTVYIVTKNAYCMKLYFEFDCLDIFAKPVWQSPSSMFHFLKSS